MTSDYKRNSTTTIFAALEDSPRPRSLANATSGIGARNT